MKIKRILSVIFSCTIILNASFIHAGEMRAWVSKSGDTVEAQLVKITKHHITLQGGNGKQMMIKKRQLSQQDLRYLDKLDALKQLDAAIKENAFELRGTIEQIIENDIVIFNPMRVKTSMIPDPNDKVKRMKPVMVEHEELIPIIQQYRTVLVLNARRDIDFDGGKWSGIVYPCGVEKVKRRNRILKCFTTSFNQARQKVLSKLPEQNDDPFTPKTQDSTPLDKASATDIRELTTPLKIKKESAKTPKRIRMK